MAKQRPRDHEFIDHETPEAAPEVETPAPEAPAAAPAGPRRYRVTLACPTPLLHRTLEVEADGEQQAREAFCRANGISDSTHPWTIERLA